MYIFAFGQVLELRGPDNNFPRRLSGANARRSGRDVRLRISRSEEDSARAPSSTLCGIYAKIYMLSNRRFAPRKYILLAPNGRCGWKGKNG